MHNPPLNLQYDEFAWSDVTCSMSVLLSLLPQAIINLQTTGSIWDKSSHDARKGFKLSHVRALWYKKIKG